MDWQLMRILLYSAFAALAVLLILFGQYWNTPTAAQYFGLARNADPVLAATTAYERGDFRFLSVPYDWQGARLEERVTGIAGCWNHPAGSPLPVRENTGISLHDNMLQGDLTEFASHYNVTLALLLNRERYAGCTIVRMY